MAQYNPRSNRKPTGSAWIKTSSGEDCDDNNNLVTSNCYKNYYIDNDGDGWDGGTIFAIDDNGGLYKTTTKGKDCDDNVKSLENKCGTTADCEGKISKEKLLEAARILNIKPEHILAVFIVESEGNAFRNNGDPKILFERHYFSALTNGRYDMSNPDISNPVQGGYGLYSEQLEKLNRAYALDPEAAIRSASFGAFQIMGKNYSMCGYIDVAKFHDDMTSRNLDLHLKAFTNYVITDNLQDELRNNQWADFARQYNGKKYKKTKYDTKMAEAYQKLIDNINLMLKDCF